MGAQTTSHRQRYRYRYTDTDRDTNVSVAAAEMYFLLIYAFPPLPPASPPFHILFIMNPHSPPCFPPLSISSCACWWTGEPTLTTISRRNSNLEFEQVEQLAINCGKVFNAFRRMSKHFSFCHNSSGQQVRVNSALLINSSHVSNSAPKAANAFKCCPMRTINQLQLFCVKRQILGKQQQQ